MIDSRLRPFFQTIWFEPLASILIRLHLRPNHLTILAVIFGLGAACAIATAHNALALALLVLSGMLDACDGTVARRLGVSSNHGCILDIVGDRVVETAIVIGFFLYDPASRGLPALLMLASFYLCITTFLLSGIFEQNQSQKSFHYSPGMIERAEAFIFFATAILFPSVFEYVAYVFAAMVTLTALVRFLELIKLFSHSRCQQTFPPGLDENHQATTLTADQTEAE